MHDKTIANSSGEIMLTNKLFISMVWPCHEERGRVNAQGCDAVKDEGKETRRKHYVARHHRSPPEMKEHTSERSPPNDMFRELTR